MLLIHIYSQLLLLLVMLIVEHDIMPEAVAEVKLGLLEVVLVEDMEDMEAAVPEVQLVRVPQEEQEMLEQMELEAVVVVPVGMSIPLMVMEVPVVQELY
jgi:hypothetical protein